MRSDEPVADDVDGRTTRRRFLTAKAGLAAAAVAGCPEATERTFEATPAVLPEDARRRLGLGEVLLDSRTTTRQIGAVDGEVTLTSYAAAYTREEAYDLEGADYAPQPTLVERFTGRGNGTDGPGAGRVVAASALGVDEVTVLGDLGIESPRVSLVVPAGAVGEESQPIPSSVFALALVEADEIAVPEGVVGYAVPAKDLLPDGEWFDRGRKYAPSRGWFPGVAEEIPPDLWSPDSPVLVALGDRSPEELFGVPAGEMPGERVTGGTTSGSTNPFLVAIPGDAFINYPGGEISVGRLLDAAAGGPLPGGGTYGFGVLSTPNAEVAGRSVNPLVRMPFEELLVSDLAYDLVGQVVFPGDMWDEYRWVDGPSTVADASGLEGHFDGVALLGEEADTATLGGVAHGGPGPFPWFVLATVARATSGDSAVVAAGVQRTPVGSADHDWENWFSGGTEQPFNPFLDWARNGGEMTGRAGEVLLNGDVDTVFGLDGGSRR